MPLFPSLERVANVLASCGFLRGGHGLLGFFLSFGVLLLSSSLGAGEDKTGSQAMSASFTTNLTNAEKGGKFTFSSFQ